jgi:cell division protein FtsN
MTTTGVEAFEMSEEQVPKEPPEDDSDKWGALRLIGLVALVAAFSGFVYLAYMQGVRNGSVGAPPVLTAQTGPYKVPPAEPGGRTFANTDKLIYDRVVGDTTGLGKTTTAKSAEAPAQPSAKAASTGQERVVDGQTGALVIAESGAAPITPMQRPSGVVSSAESGRNSAQGGPVSSVTVQAPRKVPDAAPSEAAPARAAASAPLHSASGPIADSAVSHARDGAYLIQIASYRDRPSAEEAWTKLIAKHADLVSSLSPDYQSAQIANKGTYYRLRVGPFDSREDASALCSVLKARRQDCLVVKS